MQVLRRLRRAANGWFFVWLGAMLLTALACSRPATPPVTDAADAGATDLSAGDQPTPPPETLTLTRLFPTETNKKLSFFGCLFASPLRYKAAGGDRIIVADGGGSVSALNPTTGALVWQLRLPVNDTEDPFVVGTPVIVGQRLVVGYHTVAKRDKNGAGPNVVDPRLRHRVAVVDLETGQLDSAFPPIDLVASKPSWDNSGDVPFLPSRNLGRAALSHGVAPGDTLGRVYVTFGNAQDLQPWHGWIFEISLDQWQSVGTSAAISASLVVTPETECGSPGHSGSGERICGGGLWAPSGQLLIKSGDGFVLILAPGNGQLDLSRKDYANTLMKVGPGLVFDPLCDADKCKDFDPDAPSLACVASCENLFIPRIPEGDPPLTPESGVCESKTMFECWQQLDYVGGSTPVHFKLDNGPALLAYPTKDGQIYLVDADNLGTLYHRLELAKVCGTKSDPCYAGWAGMIVTQPALTTGVDGKPLLVVPTFMPDKTHPAGIIGLTVTNDAGVGPRFKKLWEYPAFDSAEAVKRFRIHPSRMQIAPYGPNQDPIGWVVEVPGGKPGTLIGLRVTDGKPMVETTLVGPGYRFTLPLVNGDTVYVNSCDGERGPGHIEAYRISHE